MMAFKAILYHTATFGNDSDCKPSDISKLEEDTNATKGLIYLAYLIALTNIRSISRLSGVLSGAKHVTNCAF